MKAKVFSVEKFIGYSRSLGTLEDTISESCKWWANECDGMTEEKMEAIGLFCHQAWFIEKEEL